MATDPGFAIPFRDWLTMGGFAVMITAYVVNARAAAKILSGRLEVIDATLMDFKNEMKKLQEVIIAQAMQNARLNNMDERLIAETRRLDRMEEAMLKRSDE